MMEHVEGASGLCVCVCEQYMGGWEYVSMCVCVHVCV